MKLERLFGLQLTTHLAVWMSSSFLQSTINHFEAISGQSFLDLTIGSGVGPDPQLVLARVRNKCGYHRSTTRPASHSFLVARHLEVYKDTLLLSENEVLDTYCDLSAARRES
ncbi:MAG: hypothetical protein CL912_32005 [Deltaproteobacteria bacterium]|nr:hypothetical protein [Deltaproteobacteria bacterium]